jgi:NAD(P)-dependent dehydrogenase (short-subunit alcohol dehydrogenase family)
MSSNDVKQPESPPSSQNLRDHVWFITGASVGFGRALAEEVLGRGGRVAATARNASAVAPLQARAPDRVLPLVLDVTKGEQIDAAVRAAERRFGQIDVLVNNAGYGFLGGMEEGSDAEARAQFDVNFFGLCSLTRTALPLMRRRRSGCIVNMSSVAGVFAMAGSAYYSATKFAVEALSESLAGEVKPFGIRVLIVEPGAFRTEFFGRSMATPAGPIADYTELAAMRANLHQMDGAQPGDPVLAARAIVDTVMSPAPPLRLLLGSGAFERARKALAARLEELDRNRAIALAVEFPK